MGSLQLLTLLGLASVVVTGLMTAAVMLGVLLVKTLFFVITLPFRIAFGVLFFPFWLAKTVVKLAVGVVMVPLLLLVRLYWPCWRPWPPSSPSSRRCCRC